MKIAVAGLWHLGVVYSVGLSHLGHKVIAFDSSLQNVETLKKGDLPVYEPDLLNLLRISQSQENIVFTDDYDNLMEVDLLIVAYDTPIDQSEKPDSALVIRAIEKIICHISTDTEIMISSQLPVGSSSYIEKVMRDKGLEGNVIVQPENLRLGKSVETFFKPERIIIGTSNGEPSEVAISLFMPLKTSLVWVKRESAEVIKHALNAYLAMNVAFMGEIAEICEQNGADAKEVEMGLKTDSRVGEKAYLSPGLGFSGNTLSRELFVLSKLQSNSRPKPTLLESILISNAHNNSWLRRQLESYIQGNSKLKICFWGVTYVENTSTLRGSIILDTMNWLNGKGHEVSFVESIEIDESELRSFTKIQLLESFKGCNALVVYKNFFNNSWTKKLSDDLLDLAEKEMVILDPFAYLAALEPSFYKSSRYITVGKG